MGNKFGNFPSRQDAIDDLIADGFTLSDSGNYVKRGMTSGTLIDEPYETLAIVEITAHRIDGRYASDGLDYHTYQQHFI